MMRQWERQVMVLSDEHMAIPAAPTNASDAAANSAQS
jgi:hypothetical protein